MTKNEAIKFSRDNSKRITHRYFGDSEYIIVRGNRIVTEEGYSMWLNEFYEIRGDESWNIDWEEYTKI